MGKVPMKWLIASILFLGCGAGLWFFQAKNPLAEADLITRRWVPVIFANDLTAISQLSKAHGLSSQMNDIGQTPLHFACGSYRIRYSDRELLKQNPSFKTHEREAVVNQLLLAGADANVVEAKGWTPLHYCVYHGHLQSVRAFIEHGAKGDIESNKAHSALSLARDMSYLDIVDVLAK